MTLVGVGFAAWVYGRNPPGEKVGHGAFASAIAVLTISIGLWSATGASPVTDASTVNNAEHSGPQSEPFSRTKLAALISQKRSVFVNLTAAWCITCKVNERIALRSEGIAKAFGDHNVAYLIGDWTNGNPEITELLKAHGRAGVPLYLLYPGGGNTTPRILPQLLTEAIVMSHLAELKGEQQAPTQAVRVNLNAWR
jgi:thiol:disulfide interchange protein DsbD